MVAPLTDYSFDVFPSWSIAPTARPGSGPVRTWLITQLWRWGVRLGLRAIFRLAIYAAVDDLRAWFDHINEHAVAAGHWTGISRDMDFYVIVCPSRAAAIAARRADERTDHPVPEHRRLH